MANANGFANEIVKISSSLQMPMEVRNSLAIANAMAAASLAAQRMLFRNALVTPTPHIQGKDMNKNLETNMTPNASKQGKFGSYAAIFFVHMFALCVGGWGLKMIPQL